MLLKFLAGILGMIFAKKNTNGLLEIILDKLLTA